MPEFGITIFAIVSLLVLAVLLQRIAQLTRLPQSLLLTAAGIAIGCCLFWVPWPALGIEIFHLDEIALSSLGSDAVVYLLLIPLVFQSAICINVDYLKEVLAPILFLAVIGTIGVWLVVGLALHQVTDFSLVICLLVGAIIASTDPAPVQEVFQRIGVPSRLNLMVEGESLLSDSAVFISVAVVMGFAYGATDISYGSVLWEFATVTLGAILFGWGIGRATILIMGWCGDSAIAKSTLALAMACLSYYLVGDLLGYSGAFAVITLGLVLSSSGRAACTPSQWDAIVSLSSEMAFISKSLVFLVIGILTPFLTTHVSLTAIYWVFFIFAVAFATRALVMFGALPLVEFFHSTISTDWRQRAVLFWGGSRGAVPLALALSVAQNESIAPQTRELVGSVICLFVVLTILVNSISMGWLLQLLNLRVLDPKQQAIKERAIFDALSELSEELRRDYGEQGSLPAVVQSGLEQFDKRSRALFEVMTKRAGLAHEEWLSIGLLAVAQFEQRIYLKYREHQLIEVRTAMVLLEHTHQLINHTRHQGLNGYRAAHTANWRLPGYKQWFAGKASGALLQWWLHREVSTRLKSAFVQVLVLEEITEKADSHIAKLVYRDVMDEVLVQVRWRLRQMRAELDTLAALVPGAVEFLEHRLHQLSLTRLEWQKFDDLYAENIISEEVHGELLGELAARMANTLHSTASNAASIAPDKVPSAREYLTGKGVAARGFAGATPPRS